MPDVNARTRDVSTSYNFRKMLEFSGKKREAGRDRRWMALKAKEGMEQSGDIHPIILADFIDGKLAPSREEAFVNPCGTKIWTWQSSYDWDELNCGEGWILSLTPWPATWHVPFGWPPIPAWYYEIIIPPGVYLIPYVSAGCVYDGWPVEWPPPVPAEWPAYPVPPMGETMATGWWKPEVVDCPDLTPVYVPPWYHA